MSKVQRPDSLVNLTANSLRESIARKDWVGYLPSERYLSDLLQVSRPTLRDAIVLLDKEGFIICRKGCRPRIAQRKKAGPSKEPKIVNFLTSFDPLEGTIELTFYINEIRRHLQDAGYHLEVIYDPRLEGRSPRRLLEGLAGKKRASAWILHSLPATIQLWFEEQRLPALIYGTASESVNFASLDSDSHAVGFHAANLFLSRGHRKLMCLQTRRASGGALALKEGFREAAARHRNEGDVRVKAEWYDVKATMVSARLAQSLRESGCTAILVDQALPALMVVSHLIRAGVRIPEDLSIISFDADKSLEYFVPQITRYRYDFSSIARKLSRMVMQLCRQKTLPKRTIRIIPAFEPGATFGNAPNGK